MKAIFKPCAKCEEWLDDDENSPKSSTRAGKKLKNDKIGRELIRSNPIYFEELVCLITSINIQFYFFIL